MRRQDKICKEWADGIRKSLMVGAEPELTKSIDEIRSESGTSETQARLRKPGPWMFTGKVTPFMELIRGAGLEVSHQSNAEGLVDFVTFRLNETWLGIRQRFGKVAVT